MNSWRDKKLEEVMKALSTKSMSNSNIPYQEASMFLLYAGALSFVATLIIVAEFSIFVISDVETSAGDQLAYIRRRHWTLDAS